MEEQLNNALIAEPVQFQERIEVLDIIRGFALLGILLVHMPVFFGTPYIYLITLGIETWTGTWDKIATDFIGIFVQGKFYTMFSFLFGLGFVIFYERAKEKGIRSTWLFSKRLFVLLIIGLLHGFFIWYGDVLVSYALIGFLLPLFYRVKPKFLLIWAAVFFTIMIGIAAVNVLAMNILPEAMKNEIMQPMIEKMQHGLENSYLAYGQGSFADIMAQRSADTLFGLSQLFVALFLILPIFILGIYAAKRGFFQNISANLSLFKKMWIIGLVIGLIMSAIKYYCSLHANPLNPSIYDFLQMTSGLFGDLGLSIFYMTSIILLFQKKNWVPKLKPFGYVGRMALSNYLLQSIICTTIFYSYGLGLYGKISPVVGFGLAIVIFIAQIFISKWWLARYQFGPVEWLWKSLTYGKRFKNSKI